jgi:[acyl-carrier-protein] S-malonyltransferase
MLFAGQGAQVVGMMADLYREAAPCRDLMDRAAAALGWDIRALCFSGPESELTRSDRCQPAVFLAGYAAFKALLARVPLVPAGAAGLSLGEWTALCAAGVLGFDDTLRVLEARGRFMQEACDEQPGGMVSIVGLPLEKVEEVARASGLEVANLNSPVQTVLSGPRAGIPEAEKKAKELGARMAVVLNVAGAYHSSLMASAARKLEDFLRPLAFAAPAFPVISNVTGQPHTSPDEIKRLMVSQVTSRVQWVSSIAWFQAQGVTRYIECGPGKVLTGLVKRIDPKAALLNVQDVPSLNAAAAAL